jgi:hypothetical protein
METKLERDDGGDFLLDPALLAERFAIDAERFLRLVRTGQVKSSVEQGLARTKAGSGSPCAAATAPGRRW